MKASIKVKVVKTEAGIIFERPETAVALLHVRSVRAPWHTFEDFKHSGATARQLVASTWGVPAAQVTFIGEDDRPIAM